MSVVKTNIQIQKLKALDRKHKELKDLNGRNETTKSTIEHIDKLEKETENGLRKRKYCVCFQKISLFLLIKSYLE